MSAIHVIETGFWRHERCDRFCEEPGLLAIAILGTPSPASRLLQSGVLTDDYGFYRVDAAHANARSGDTSLDQYRVTALNGALDQARLDLADRVDDADVSGDVNWAVSPEQL
jgi:hypothetical protein